MASVNDTALKYLSPYSSAEAAFLVGSLILIILVSLAGGLVMMFVLYTNSKMWTSTNVLIGNLALTGTCLALCVMPVHLITSAKQRWTFGEGNVCKYIGFSGSLFLLATIFTHMVISIDKYFAVVRPMSRFMTVKKTGVAVAIVWLAAAIMSIAPLGGIARFEYNPTTLTCGIGFPTGRLDLLYLLLLAGLGFILPLWLMGVAYIRVYFAVKKHSARLMAHCVLSSDVLFLQRRLILTVFASLVCFLVCWSTFFALTITALIVKDQALLPHGLGIAAYWTGYMNSALNPLIICSLSNRFKEGFIDICSELIFLSSSSCLRRPPEVQKKRTETKSMVTQVVLCDNATAHSYKESYLQNQIEPSEIDLYNVECHV